MTIAYLALGANLPSPAGPPDATLAAALERISELGRVVVSSSLYSTSPVGYADQPRFLNAAAAVETQLGPRDLLDSLLAIERDFGRDRVGAILNGPRTLDLDILLYGDLTVSESGLEIPHPRLAERGFVLIPLNEIAPDARDPRSGAKVKELLLKLRASLPPNLHQTKNEVVAIESDCWRAGRFRAVAGSNNPRANADPHHG
ncbi:MAG: 2-amino-4-hydroxy-6-hydroxymethyldihydropteridine diphosphokinase [Terracidiphilus sp.]|jgi:2-amino-4-hydroxy-6-hydroxymethyldihydropteridine diphosphokinase